MLYSVLSNYWYYSFGVVSSFGGPLSAPSEEAAAKPPVTPTFNSTVSDEKGPNKFSDWERQLLESYEGRRLSPVWWPSCSSDNNSGRLIFVHVFKTAGSSFRSFLLDHVGPTCGKSVVEMAGCSHISHASILGNQSDTYWKSIDEKGRCYTPLTRIVNNNSDNQNMTIVRRRPLNVGWVEKYGDIVVGHLPLGLHAYLNQHDNSSTSSSTPHNYQYVTFVRDPVHKYVSGRLYLHPEWTMEEAVSNIQAKVTHAVSKREYYNAYERYWTTPQQKENATILSKEDTVRQLQQNLVDMNVLVGVVEDMGASLGLLQSVLDADQQLTGILQTLNPSLGGNHSKNSSSLVVNQSRLSTTAIVRQLTDDTAFVRQVRAYLKYEFRVYNFAVALHDRQVAQLRQRHGDRYLQPFVT